MAWDFSTDPEFQAQLDWMRAFVDNEIEPLELFYDDMSDENWRKRHRAAQAAGEGPRPVGVPPRSRARRPGLRPGEARADARDPRPLQHGAERLRQPGARLGQQRAHRDRRAPPSRSEQWLEPLLRGEITSSFSLTEPHYSGSDPTMINTHAVRDGDEYVINGHKWFASNASKADFILDDGGDEPRQPAAQGGVDVHHPEGHAGPRTSCATSTTCTTRTRATSARAATPRSSSRTAACRSRTASAPRATASCSRRSGCPAGASTTRCAGSASATRRST